MARTKAIVRRFPKINRIPPWRMNRGERNQKRQRYKIKLTLPEQKTVDIKKNGNVIKTIRAKRRSKYFTDRWVKQF